MERAGGLVSPQGAPPSKDDRETATPTAPGVLDPDRTAGTAATTQAATVPSLLQARAAESPALPAFFYETENGWQSITWARFAERARRIACALHQRGLQAGEHVGILAPTGLGWELFHHAVLHAGGVVVGLEPHDIAERLQWIADHAELRALVVGDAELLAKLRPSQIARYRLVILLRGGEQAVSPCAAVDWRDLEDELGELSLSALPDIRPEAPATLIYTSGTTGQPKGILYRHDQVALAVRAITRAYPSIGNGARFVCWLPLSNLFQRIMNLAAMNVGGTAYLVRDPLAVTAALPIAKPDVFIGVPRFYEKLHEGIERELARQTGFRKRLVRTALDIGDRMARARRTGTTVPSAQKAAYRVLDLFVLRKLRALMGGRVQFMITGSAPTAMRLLEFFDSIGLPLYEAYGLSENIVPMALNRPQAYRLGTVGQPLEENSILIDDDGELLVKGPGVFAGYHNESGAKSSRFEAFTSDGYYRTGDYASIDEDGFLRLHGRKSEIIKTSTGRRISPLGIEAALETIPEVGRAIVVGAGRKCLVAILILAPGGARTSSQAAFDSQVNPAITLPRSLSTGIAKTCTSLSAHERPAGFLLTNRQLSISGGDLTPNLKLRRKALEERYALHLEALYREIDEKAGETIVRPVEEGQG